MSFSAPSSVPQIDYASYSSPPNPLPHPHSAFSTFPLPTAWDVHTTKQTISKKAALLRMLKNGQVSNLPFGFPFRCLPGTLGTDGINYGRPQLSISSYEFPQDVFVDFMSPKYCAIFSYTAPANHGDPAARNGKSSSKMTWRISIPLQDDLFSNKAQAFTTVSQVEVDPMIIEVPGSYGEDLMIDKTVILKALAESLELGLHITVKRRNVSQLRQCARGRLDDLVFVAMNDLGQQWVMNPQSSVPPGLCQ